jgi:hypothetical protein
MHRQRRIKPRTVGGRPSAPSPSRPSFSRQAPCYAAAAADANQRGALVSFFWWTPLKAGPVGAHHPLGAAFIGRSLSSAVLRTADGYIRHGLFHHVDTLIVAPVVPWLPVRFAAGSSVIVALIRTDTLAADPSKKAQSVDSRRRNRPVSCLSAASGRISSEAPDRP